MAHPLIGLHAALGELGAIAFLWVFVELWNPTPERIKRAKFVAVIGVILLLLSWFTGGFYYVNYYGDVKAIIKEGPQPWAHLVFTETKEHVFLFLPFLATFTAFILGKSEKDIIKSKKVRKSVMSLSLLIFLIALAMAGMGYLISTGARAALEVGVL